MERPDPTRRTRRFENILRGEKHIRVGAIHGGNRNCSVYATRNTKKSQAPDDIILRKGVLWMGGVGVMAILGLCHRAKWTSHIVPAGTKADSTEYINVQKYICAPDCHQYYGGPPDCIPQQDWATSRAPNMAYGYFRRKSPKCCDKGELPPDPPDLDPLDYF